jgi:thiamine biosynthesis lipoprotein
MVLISLVVVVLGLGTLALLSRNVLQPQRLQPRASLGEPPAEPGRQEFVTFSAEAMHTAIQVTLPEREGAEAAAGAVFAACREVDAVMSEWKDTSPLAAVNREAGVRAVPVPGELRRVIHRGIEIGAATDGAFDITWAALWGLWDFKALWPMVLPATEVDSRWTLVDYRRIAVEDEAGTVGLPEAGMKIGLGGIAKGYAVDRAVEILRERGFENFMVLTGGQVMAHGIKHDRPWRIGIRDPRGRPDDYFAFVEIRDASVSTSGDYESYFEIEGVRYHHILDPRTGRPARGLRSATVLAREGILADALSTAFVVLGPEASLRVAAELGVEAVLVDDAGRVITTPGLGEALTVLHAPAP